MNTWDWYFRQYPHIERVNIEKKNTETIYDLLF